ncbi:unnamed protein product [Chrysoparadoxa australica]
MEAIKERLQVANWARIAQIAGASTTVACVGFGMTSTFFGGSFMHALYSIMLGCFLAIFEVPQLYGFCFPTIRRLTDLFNYQLYFSKPGVRSVVHVAASLLLFSEFGLLTLVALGLLGTGACYAIAQVRGEELEIPEGPPGDNDPSESTAFGTFAEA